MPFHPPIPGPPSGRRTIDVPETDAGHTALSAIIPDEQHARAFLMQDGNWAVPGGRYGDDTRSCAPVAIAITRILEDSTGDPMTYADLDHAMGLVVNSHDEVAYMIREYGPSVGIDPADYLDAEDLQDDDEDPEGCPDCGQTLSDPDEEWCDCGWVGSVSQ